jgi:hypothetical protein
LLSADEAFDVAREVDVGVGRRAFPRLRAQTSLAFFPTSGFSVFPLSHNSFQILFHILDGSKVGFSSGCMIISHCSAAVSYASACLY